VVSEMCQREVRNIWNNLAVYNLNLWMHTLTELWTWDRSGRMFVVVRLGSQDETHVQALQQS